jgi:hypothetical protein
VRPGRIGPEYGLLAVLASFLIVVLALLALFHAWVTLP